MNQRTVSLNLIVSLDLVVSLFKMLLPVTLLFFLMETAACVWPTEINQKDCFIRIGFIFKI